MAQAFLEVGDDENVILLTKAAIVQRVPDGRLGVMDKGSPTDPALGGEAYWHAVQFTGDREIHGAVQDMLDWILHKAPRAPDGTLYQIFEGSQVWSDGYFSAPCFLAAMGRYDEALFRIGGYRKRLWDPDKKLLAHIWDDGEKADNRKEFWGGGNGWAAAGLARMIRLLPPGRKDDRQRLTAFVTDLLDGCLAHQRPDGLFHDVVDRPDTFLETNLAQMLAFAIYTGLLADGCLSASVRRPIACAPLPAPKWTAWLRAARLRRAEFRSLRNVHRSAGLRHHDGSGRTEAGVHAHLRIACSEQPF